MSKSNISIETKKSITAKVKKPVYCFLAGKEIGVASCLASQSEKCFGCAASSHLCHHCWKDVVAFPEIDYCDACLTEALSIRSVTTRTENLCTQCNLFAAEDAEHGLCLSCIITKVNPKQELNKKKTSCSPLSQDKRAQAVCSYSANLLQFHRHYNTPYSQKDVATLIGHKSSSQICKWEKGVIRPSTKNLIRLAKILGLSAKEMHTYLETNLALEHAKTSTLSFFPSSKGIGVGVFFDNVLVDARYYPVKKISLATIQKKAEDILQFLFCKWAPQNILIGNPLPLRLSKIHQRAALIITHIVNTICTTAKQYALTVSTYDVADMKNYFFAKDNNHNDRSLVTLAYHTRKASKKLFHPKYNKNVLMREMKNTITEETSPMHLAIATYIYAHAPQNDTVNIRPPNRRKKRKNCTPFRTSLSAHAKLIYLYLRTIKQKNNDVSAYAHDIAEACSCSLGTVQKATNELAKENFIIKIKTSRRPNIYRLVK